MKTFCPFLNKIADADQTDWHTIRFFLLALPGTIRAHA